MPVYPMYCDRCKKEAELECTMSEYDLLKDSFKCEDCGNDMSRDFSKSKVNAIWNCDCPSVSGGKQPK